MAVWEHLNVDKAHVAYACVGVFSTCFSLCSLFIKEKLYVGEATVASIFGLIVGPHCLNWFAPTTWGNSDYITLEISRMVLIIQIFAVAVELPKKYMLKHWFSVFIFLVPVMTVGWLMVGLFVWILIPGLNFSESLLVAACVTATDPVLAAAVVGKGKFARRVPGHLRNILSAESGCNDGMAFPFIYLGMNLVIHSGEAGEIIKDWICVTILYECILGCFIGAAIGYFGRRAIRFAEEKDLIDRESFLAFYVVLSFVCAGFGSILGVDDLLVSFAAGTAFAWDGWFAHKTEESHVSTVIDLLLNLAYFVYFGAIIPWEKYNDGSLGLNDWRLVVLAFVVIFLRRIPAVMALKPITPDVKNWKEALFCGHFGPIGVGAVFAAILAKSELESDETGKRGPLKTLPGAGTEYYQLIEVIWPIVSFLVIVSIIVHGSSVAVMTLGRHLQTMTFTMTMTHTEGSGHGGWVNRLPKLDSSGRSMSLHRIDTMAHSEPTIQNSIANTGLGDRLSAAPTIETSGVPARPAGGMRRRKKKRGLKHMREKNKEHLRERPVTESLDLRQLQRDRENAEETTPAIEIDSTHSQLEKVETTTGSSEGQMDEKNSAQIAIPITQNDVEYDSDGDERRPTRAYEDGHQLIIEDQHGEVMSVSNDVSEDSEAELDAVAEEQPSSGVKSPSIHSFSSLEKHMTRLSRAPSNEEPQKREKLASFRKLISGSTSGPQNKVAVTKRPRPDGGSNKYFGYRIDDQIIIEDADGEIIRRYRINTHRDSAQRPRSNSTGGIRRRALSLVGLGPKMEQRDVERAQATNSSIIPETQEGEPRLANERRLERKVTDFLRQQAGGSEDAVAESSEEVSDSYEQDTEEDDDDDDEYDDIPGESEYERARRLAALHTSERLDDDEEEVPKSSRT